MNTSKIGRRSALLSVGLGIAAGASAFMSTAKAAETMTPPAGAKTLADLSDRLFSSRFNVGISSTRLMSRAARQRALRMLSHPEALIRL